MNPSNGPVLDSAEATIQRMSKQVLANARRPQIKNASQIMGPGLAPYAVEIKDWSGDETNFNGFFYSRPGSFNSPDGTKWWIGQCIAQAEGFGIQTVYDYRGTTNPPVMKTRKFSLSGSLRVFTAWA